MKDLKEKTIEELTALLAETKNESHSLRYSFASTQKSNVNKSRELKKTIAHIETILSNRKK